MADARRHAAWEHTSWICAMIANVNRDPKRHPRPYEPRQFNPLMASRDRTDAIRIDKDTIGDLKKAFTPYIERTKGQKPCHPAAPS